MLRLDSGAPEFAKYVGARTNARRRDSRKFAIGERPIGAKVPRPRALQPNAFFGTPALRQEGMDQGSGNLAISSGDKSAAEVQSLKDEIEQLKAQVLARDNLLAVAAHELRNPMHALLLQITAALAVAKRDRVDALIPRLERIRHIVDIYVKRATMLLDAARLDAGGWPLERRTFDLCQVVREICTSYEPEAQHAGCTISLHVPPNLFGRWDRVAVEQVAANLLSNAIKYGAGTPIDVSLSTARSDALLSVRDRGPGIAASDQTRIFERFEQAVGSREKRSGFGIGLWLAKSLVEAHGGNIDVQSEPGAGSTFTVRLPGIEPPFEN
jgi:signal transduction histidine kinase